MLVFLLKIRKLKNNFMNNQNNNQIIIYNTEDGGTKTAIWNFRIVQIISILKTSHYAGNSSIL